MTPSTSSPSTSASPTEVMAALDRLSARADEVMRLLAAEPQATAHRSATPHRRPIR